MRDVSVLYAMLSNQTHVEQSSQSLRQQIKHNASARQQLHRRISPLLLVLSQV